MEIQPQGQKDSQPGKIRRRFLRGGVFAWLACLFSAAARSAEAADVPAPADGLQRRGDPVTTRLRKGDPPVQPLDSMLVFERGDNNNGPAGTHEVLSLIHQEKGKVSFPWTLYASLETHHETGDACVVCSACIRTVPAGRPACIPKCLITIGRSRWASISK